MKAFEHVSAPSLDVAVSMLGVYGGTAAVIAGGTDLLGTLKDNIHEAYPQALVNVKAMPGLSYVNSSKDGLRIGALTTLHEIATNPDLRERYGMLAEAARLVGSPQIRRMGTIGGNICQEPRCWYYRYPDNTFHCIRKGGEICNALTGQNQFHSIFGAMRSELPRCNGACPAEVDMPTYMHLIRQGDLSGAASLLLKANPIPAITGRVCPHFCEEACNRGEFDEAVSIRGVERFLGDYILEKASELMVPAGRESGKTVAIVGSGPAGLSAAYYLRRRGHGVVIFDRLHEPGGMLAYAIPAYRLPGDVVERVATAMEGMGVQFRLRVDVGDDVSLDQLRNEFDSVFLATGAWGHPSIGVEGEELTRPGLRLLTDVRLGLQEAPKKRVVVIGGGSVAVDVAITMRRLGAEKVTLVCLECREEMPALEEEIEEALEEGIKLLPSWGPTRILERDGKVAGVELVRCTSVFDENACFAPAFDGSVTHTVEADQVMMAVGQKVDASFLSGDWSELLRAGVVVADPITQATDVPGVFAGGDVTSGRGTVVEAIAAGRRAAAAIDQHLRGVDVRGEDEQPIQTKSLLTFSRDALSRTDRTQVRRLPPSSRALQIEDALGFGASDAEREADRCFNCGCVAVSPSDLAPTLIALDATIQTTKRTVKAEDFFGVGQARSTTLGQDELVREILIPALKANSRQVFLKFRLRNSIDFPVVAVAVVIAKQGDKVSDARIVLGAVAPIPLRITEAEDFLKGRVLDEGVAETAASIALQDVAPLAKNAYKVQVAKALVRRALVAVR